MAPMNANSILRHPCWQSAPWVIVLAASLLVGCSSSSPEATDAKAETVAAEKPSEIDEQTPAGPFKYGNLLEPFDPPPLEELLEAHEWVDRPVVDSLKQLREEQATLDAPELSAKQALALRNDSPENNAEILDALGRVAPKDGAGVNYDAEITLIADAELKSTNPLLMSSSVEFDYNDLAGFGLFSFDKQFNKFAVADTVASWQTSEDRTVDKVVIRDDLTWSDGTPITAHDIVFTFQAILTDQVIVPALRSGTDQIKWIEAYDDQTLVYFHKEALATNDGNMNFPVMPKHIYEKTIPEDPSMARSAVHSKYEDEPVVGGPYELVKRVRGQEFTLRRREDYYMHNGKQVRDKPYFKKVTYKVIEDRNTALLALKSGKVDSMMLNAEQWHGQTSDKVFYRFNTKASGTEWTTFQFCWNTETPYFADKQVRRAMSYAMDYEELLNTILYGMFDASRGNFHPDSRMFPKNGPQPYRQDLDRAEDLLDEAGWADSDGDGIRDKKIDGRLVPFEFTLLVVNYDDRIKIATLMKECLDSIGIVCHVKPTEFTVLTQMQRDHKFQAAYSGWGSGADPDTNSNIFATNAGRNYGSYSNPLVDELFERAKREFDEEKRYALYGEIHTALWEDQPYTWLFTRNSFFGFNKQLRGYNFSPRGPFNYGPGFSSFYVPVEVP